MELEGSGEQYRFKGAQIQTNEPATVRMRTD